MVTTAGFAEGVRRFIIGLAKKMLIANTVAVAGRRDLCSARRELNFGLAWLGVACYTLQIYFDFSGYSDMAIGLAKLFGIDFLENFNYPYAARSVTEFWRRWHISLSTWFRDYLYIPLGGNRLRPRADLLQPGRSSSSSAGSGTAQAGRSPAGASFTAPSWCSSARRRARINRFAWSPVRHLYTLLVVSAGWVLFRADTMPQAVAFLRAMAGLGTGQGLSTTSVSISIRS